MAILANPASDARRILTNAVAAAVMAPSSHNTQPWRFRIVGAALEVLADPLRQLVVIDADRRQLLQSCGCAIFNARAAIRAMGYRDRVALLPDPERPHLIACLQLGAPIGPSPADQALVQAMALRRTNRRPFLDRPVALEHSDPMIEVAAREGAWAVRLDPDQKRHLGGLVDRADRQQYADPQFRAELASWLVGPGSLRRDGIPFVEKEYGSAMPFSMMRTIRSPGLGAEFGHIEDEIVRASPIVLVLGTDRDDAAAWLAAGQALEAVLLEATALGLAAAFANQVLEIPVLRARVADLVAHPGAPQMVLRLGYPDEPIRHAAPRRELTEVLTIVE